MKPTGTKAQRKKHQAPVGVTSDLTAPPNFSVFSQWIEEEKEQRAHSRVSIESVSFTQQSPLSSASERRNISIDAVSSKGGMSNAVSAPTAIDGLQSQSFQAMNSGHDTHGGGSGANRAMTANDPFYLNSSAGFADSETSAAVSNVANRFGAIQLGDLDEDNEMDAALWQ